MTENQAFDLIHEMKRISGWLENLNDNLGVVANALDVLAKCVDIHAMSGTYWLGVELHPREEK